MILVNTLAWFVVCFFILPWQHKGNHINLANILFNFIGEFSNYVAFDEIKCLSAFTKHTAQKFIAKPQSASVS